MTNQLSFPPLVYVVDSLKRLFVRETLTALRVPDTLDIAAEQFRNTLRPDILWGLNGRFERGVALARQGAVSPSLDPSDTGQHRRYSVRSANQSRPPYSYLVDLEAGTCECPDYFKGHFCKHRIATHIYEGLNQKAFLAQFASMTPSTPAVCAVGSNGYQPQPATETALITSEAVEDNPSSSKEAIIWGVIKHQGQWLGVEVLELEDEKATIRALPKIIHGKKLQPHFPFEGKRATITIPKKHLFHVKIFQ